LPNVVRLPAVVDRADDLRGLILDRLCRSGVRFAGETIGIEPQAMGRLVDHVWPGNDGELASVVERAARVAKGERVTVADLEAAGFVAPRLEEAGVTALPRRRSERPPPGLTSEPGPPSVVAQAERQQARRRRRR
jgi:transcriptional regulator of acetoin/glycerol metabolism